MLSDNSNVEIIEVLRFSLGPVNEAYEAYVKIAEIPGSPISHIKTSIVARLKTKSVNENNYEHQYTELDEDFIGDKFICIENTLRPKISIIFSFQEDYDVKSTNNNCISVRVIAFKDIYIYKNFTMTPLKLLGKIRESGYGAGLHIIRERLTFNSQKHRLDELDNLFYHMNFAFEEIADSEDFLNHIEICRSVLNIINAKIWCIK